MIRRGSARAWSRLHEAGEEMEGMIEMAVGLKQIKEFFGIDGLPGMKREWVGKDNEGSELAVRLSEEDRQEILGGFADGTLTYPDLTGERLAAAKAKQIKVPGGPDYRVPGS